MFLGNRFIVACAVQVIFRTFQCSHYHQQYLTPAANLYVRNHAPVPPLEADAHEITIVDNTRERSEKKEITLTLEDLGRHFPTTTITSVLQCTGNRAADDIANNGEKVCASTIEDLCITNDKNNIQPVRLNRRDLDLLVDHSLV